jgi:hypothetical protein
VIPEEKVLEGHARYLLEMLIANQELEKILPEVRKQAAARKLPADLRKLVAKEFEKDAGLGVGSRGRRPGQTPAAQAAPRKGPDASSVAHSASPGKICKTPRFFPELFGDRAAGAEAGEPLEAGGLDLGSGPEIRSRTSLLSACW